MSKYTAQDLEALRRQAQEIEKVLAAQQAAREQAYAAQQSALQTQREDALRQAYISQQQMLNQLPEQLAAVGINGGAAESSLIRLNRAYGSQRADIGKQYAQAYRELQAQKAAFDADAAEQAAQNRIDYLGAESALRADLEAQQQAAVQGSAGLERRLAALQRELEALRNAAAAPAAQPDTLAKKPEKTYPARPVRSNGQLVGHTDLIR